MNLHTNPIAARVEGGTLPGHVDLCASCRFAMIRSASEGSFHEVRCGWIAGQPRVPEKLARCSSYLEKGKLTLDEMSNIAWVIEERGKHIGFLSPEELERRRMNGSVPAGRPVGF